MTAVRIAVRGSSGERKWIGRFVGPWVIRMVTIYNDLAGESGQLMPLVLGGLMDQPAREWQALRLIRAAYSDERRREMDKAKRRRSR